MSEGVREMAAPTGALETSADGAEELHPPPRVVFVRMARWSGVAACVLVVVWLAWYGWGQHRYTRAVDAWQAHHAPESLAAPAVVADGENAVAPVRQASRALTLTPGQRDTLQFDRRVRWPELLREGTTDPAMEELERAIPVNGGVLAHLVEARSRPAMSWRTTTDQAWDAPVNAPDSIEMAALCQFLYFSALVANRDGRSDLVVARAHDLMTVGRALEAHPTLDAHRGALNAYNLAARAIERSGWHLQMTRGGPGTAADAGAVRALIAVLLADGTLHHETLRMLERQIGRFPAMVARGDGTWGVLLPLYQLDAARAMDRLAAEYAAAHVGHWPAVEETRRKGEGFLGRLSHPFAAMSYTGHLENVYRAMVDRRAAAVSLAVALYRADHGGAVPAQLSDLVPGYLPKAPVDVFRRDGGTLGYRGGTQAAVWSVGYDGEDNGGLAGMPMVRGAWGRWRELDAVYRLEWSPPTYLRR